MGEDGWVNQRLLLLLVIVGVIDSYHKKNAPLNIVWRADKRERPHMSFVLCYHFISCCLYFGLMVKGICLFLYKFCDGVYHLLGWNNIALQNIRFFIIGAVVVTLFTHTLQLFI